MKKVFLCTLLLGLTLSVSAICQGSSTNVDNFYTNADKNAVNSMTNGFTWQCETSGTSVNISVTFLDALAGMAAPDLFLFDNKGVLIGNPIQMGWNATTRTATYTLTGQTIGNKISFLVKVALDAGKVLFTERVVYEVGSNCDGQEEQPVASCSGSGTGTDTYYTSMGSFTKGFEWTCNTMANNDVQLEFKYLDYFPSMSGPMLFKFHMVDTNEQLDGDPIPMDWTGTIASYTFTGCQTGDKLRFLVQIAYEAGGTIYSERIEYTVGQNCEEEKGDDEKDDDEKDDDEKKDDDQGEDSKDDQDEKDALPSIDLPQGQAAKYIENGHLYLFYNGRAYNVIGTLVQ